MGSIDRSQIIAQTYPFPAVQPVGPQAPAAPINDGIEALQGLQYVENETADYYKKVSALKAFMNDVQTNYGVDVRVPDMSRPESIELNKIYQAALSDILAQGNLLKQGAAQQTQNTQMGMMYGPGVDTTKQSVATLSPGQDYWSRNAEPTVLEVNNKTQMPSYTQEEQEQKEQIYKDALAHYDEMAHRDPAKANYYMYQKSILTAPTKGQFRPTQRNYGEWKFGKDKDNFGMLLKQLVNLKHGFGAFEPTSNRAPSGELFEINRDFYGVKYGDSGKTISHIIRDPGKYDIRKDSEGNDIDVVTHTPANAKVVFTDGTREDMDELNITQLAQALGSKMGYNTSALQEFIIDNGLEGQFGRLREDKFLPNKQEAVNERRSQLSKRTAQGQLVKPIEQKLEEVVDATMKDAGWFDSEAELDLGLGKKLKLVGNKSLKGARRISIDNIEEIVPLAAFTNKNGKVDEARAQAFYASVRNVSSVKELVKLLMTRLPVDDYAKVYDALGLDMPNINSLLQPTEAPAQAPTTTNNDPLGIR